MPASLQASGTVFPWLTNTSTVPQPGRNLLGRKRLLGHVPVPSYLPVSLRLVQKSPARSVLRDRTHSIVPSRNSERQFSIDPQTPKLTSRALCRTTARTVVHSNYFFALSATKALIRCALRSITSISLSSATCVCRSRRVLRRGFISSSTSKPANNSDNGTSSASAIRMIVVNRNQPSLLICRGVGCSDCGKALDLS